MKRWLGIAALALSTGVSAAPLSLSEGFNTVVPPGWTVVNNSAPGGATSWFQGNSAIFGAQSGPAGSYAAANFLSTDPVAGGQISTWLISPVLDFASQTLAFFVRTASDLGFADGLRVHISGNGSSTSLGDFALLLSINGGSAIDGFPFDWTQFSATLLASGSGRIAFEYFVEDGLIANYIGLDSVTVTPSAVAEPATLALALLAVGLAGALRRRPSQEASMRISDVARATTCRAIALAAAAACSLPAAAEAPATAAASGLMRFPNVEVVHRPAATPRALAPATGIRAFVDPHTGQLAEPSHEDQAALSLRIPPAFEQPVGKPRTFVVRGVGIVMTTNDGSNLNYAVVRRTGDGRLMHACVSDPMLAERLVHGDAAPDRAAEERQ